MATLKLKYGAISSDDHIQEAPDVWTNRMSKAKFGDDIPHIAEQPDGSQAFIIMGKPALRGARLAIVNATTVPRNSPVRRWEDVPKMTYVPAERLKAMDLDHLDTNTFFPNVAGLANATFQREGSEEFRLACIQAFNDWLAEEWGDFSPRFIIQCIPPMWNVELAVSEIYRSIKRGHKAVIWHGAPEVLDLPYFQDPHWFPVYQACIDLDVPLCLHLGAVPTLPPWPGYSSHTSQALGGTRAISTHMQVVANVLFSGVLDLFPKLKLITVESALGWIPYMLELADHEYDQLKVKDDGLKSRPSEAFHRQMWATFWYERFGIEHRDLIGVDHILYSTDFPHPTSTWPNSQEARDRSLEGVPDVERKKILMENAIKLYRLDVDMSALAENGSPKQQVTP